MALLLTMVEAHRQQNRTLQDNVQALQTQSVQEGSTEEEPLDFRPLFKVIWDDQAPENFKPPSLISFNSKTDPHEHFIAINNQILILGASASLKCKNMSGTREGGVGHKK